MLEDPAHVFSRFIFPNDQLKRMNRWKSFNTFESEDTNSLTVIANNMKAIKFFSQLVNKKIK